MNGHRWARLLTYVSGLVNEELLLQLEYLAAENRILRAQLPNRLRLTNDQRSTLAEIGKRLGRKGLEKVATAAKPETNSRLVPKARGSEVRWLEVSFVSRQAGYQLRSRKSDCSPRPRQLQLGI